MLAAMNSSSTPSPARPRHPMRHPVLLHALTSDRASLDGLECSDGSWEEWDASVAARDRVEPKSAESH